MSDDNHVHLDLSGEYDGRDPDEVRREFADKLFGPRPEGPPPERVPMTRERVEAASRAYLAARPDLEPHPEIGVQDVIHLPMLGLTQQQADEAGVRDEVARGDYPGVFLLSI